MQSKGLNVAPPPSLPSPTKEKYPLSYFLSSVHRMIANCDPLLQILWTEHQTSFSSLWRAPEVFLLMLSNLMLVKR